VVRAVSPGSWARRVWARIDDSTARVPEADGNPQPVGFRLRLAYWANAGPDFPPFDPFAEAATLPRPTLSEDFDDLVTDATSSALYEKRLGDRSALATLERSAGVPADARPANGAQALAGRGADDPHPLAVADYQGARDPGAARSDRQGRAALELDPCRNGSLVYAPGVTDEIAQAIIAHCERLRFRFAVVDCEQGMSNASALAPRTRIQDTPYAAFYYP